jgi:hypothetical protein
LAYLVDVDVHWRYAKLSHEHEYRVEAHSKDYVAIFLVIEIGIQVINAPMIFDHNILVELGESITLPIPYID